MSTRSRVVSAITIVLLVVVLASGTAVAGGLDSPEHTQTGNEEPENETAPHENPDEVDESGDNERVGSFLSSELNELLGDSTTEISEQQYEIGRSLVGDEYDDKLERFVDVADDIDREETAEAFAQAQEAQQTTAEKSAEFDEKMDAYEVAVEEGNEERARELARELQDLASEIDESTTALDELFAQLEAETSEDFSEAQEANDEHRSRVTQDADTVREAEFRDVTVRAQTNRTEISFDSPAGVTGELRSEEGEPIGNATIELQAGADTVTTVTDSDGSFQTTYRPTLAPLDQSMLSIVYVPELDAPYLAAETNVSIAISKQVESNLTIGDTTESAAFDDTVSVTGVLTVSDKDDVANVPVRLSVSDRPLETVRTDADGEFELAGTLPKDIDSGDTTISVEVVLEDAAVRPTTATQPLRIAPTDTDLTIDVNAIDDDGLTVSGELQTDDGVPVSGELVTITVDGDQLGLAETDQEGRYATQVALDGEQEDREVTVVATFDGEGTNLHASGAEQRVTRPAASTGILSQLVDNWLVIGVLTVVVGLLLLGWLRTRDEHGGWIPFTNTSSREGTDRPQGTAETAGGDLSGPSDASSTEPQASLEQARELLADGRPGDAVVVAYSTLRGDLAKDTAVEPGNTHWEFYRQYHSSEPPDTDSLRTIIEAYETVVFAPTSVSSDTAGDAIEAMSEMIESESLG